MAGAINKGYENFFLANEIEDTYNSHLALQQFCTVNNDLVGTAGMKYKVNVYTGTEGTEILKIGEGNTKQIKVSYTPKEYEILLAQNRFMFHDEEKMTDPMIELVGTKQMGVDMFNTVNKSIYDEFAKTTQKVDANALDFNTFVDAIAKFNLEASEEKPLFAFVSVKDMAKIKKSLKDDLKYVEAFVKNGYIGTVAGVNLYVKKDAPENQVIIASKDAVTVFNKKGVEVEQSTGNKRSAEDANIRLNTIYSRKYYLAALTNNTKAVKIALKAGASQ